MKIYLLWLLGVWISLPSYGLVVETSAVQTQLDRALLTAEIEVLHLDGSRQRGDDDGITYRAEIQINRILQSNPDGVALPVEGDRIFLRGLGGETQDLGVYLTGFARPRVGRKYRASLVREGTDYAVTGFEFGLVPIDGVREFSRNRTDGSNGEGDGAFLYWGKDYLPVPYAIAAKTFIGFPEYIEAIDQSFATWQKPNGSRMAFVGSGCSRGSRNLNDGINHIILITDRWMFDRAAIAITRNFYIAGDSPRAGLILDSDILLNGVDHKFTIANETGMHDIQNIVTHEVGHFVGLGHEVSPFNENATMFAQASPNQTNKRTLKNTDIQGLLSAYTGVSDKTPLGNGASCSVQDLTAASCLAAHEPTTQPPNPAWLAFLLTLTLLVRLIGRRITR